MVLRALRYCLIGCFGELIVFGFYLRQCLLLCVLSFDGFLIFSWCAVVYYCLYVSAAFLGLLYG